MRLGSREGATALAAASRLAFLGLAVLGLSAPAARGQEPIRTLPAQEIPMLGGGGTVEPEPAPPRLGPAPAATLGTSMPDTSMPGTLGEAAGPWDLSLPGGSRRCTLTLSVENGSAGRVVRFPAGCRRALPVLANVAGWLFTEGAVRLVDRNVRPVLPFTKRPDGRSLSGRTEGGESYDLVPLQIALMLPPQAGTPEAGGIAGPREIPGSQPVLSAGFLVPPAPAPEAGVYALDRFSDKDVCRLELGTAPVPGPDKALGEARLLPNCRDSGIAVFDPIAWRFANGHMTLKARRGHAVNLVPMGDGRWRRDPDIGTTFVLRKVGEP